MNKQKILLAGKIASQIRKWIKPQIKKGVGLLEIAEKIENKILELGGTPAFPTNLSINEIAAHYTPSYNDETLAQGLLKVDFGVCVDGWISDTAFSVDLENSKENKKLIKASEKALEKAIELIKNSSKKQVSDFANTNVSPEGGRAGTLSEIGKTIQQTIESFRFSPIVNLSGHEMKKYELHAGLTIPNIENNNKEILERGLYAIEPFATSGLGKVKDGRDSGIYVLINEKNIRNSEARKILNFIIEKYKTLPFCSRWLVKKFRTKALFALRELERNGNLHHFAQLVEVSGAKVSQAEHTILVDEKLVVTTE